MRFRYSGSRPRRTDEQIAKVMSQTVWFVKRHYSLLLLVPKVFRLLGPDIPEEKRLTVSTALELVTVPPDCQTPLATEILERGLTLVQAKHLIRLTLQGKGVKSRMSKPSREFAVFAKFLERANEQLQIFLSTPAPTLRAVLCAELQERMKVYELLVQATEGFPDLKEAVRDSLVLTEAERAHERQKAVENLRSLAQAFQS